MKPRTGEWLVRLYPPAWRARYGDEFLDLLESEPMRPLLLLDLVRAAACERLFNTSGLGGHAMKTYPASVLEMVKRPSAFLPLLMSLFAGALVLFFVMALGPTPSGPQHDEELAARLFHLLMLGQLPVLLFFLMRWMPKDWRAALSVFVLQILAIAAAVAVPLTHHW
jgi:hypothetical protein